MPALDLWESSEALTTLVKRRKEDRSRQNDGDEQRGRIGDRIAPLVPVDDVVTRLRILDLPPAGLGQLKAPDATPALFKPKAAVSERVIELVLLEEMERFPVTEWQLLQSSDEEIAKRAKLNLVERLGIFVARNENLTEKLRWDAFKGGQLTLTYPTGDTLPIDYGFPAGHTPVAGTAWTDTTNADIIEDIYAWATVGANDAGRYYTKIHLNSNTWRLVIKNEKIKAYLSSLGRSILLPTEADVKTLLRSGEGTEFILNDAGYVPEAEAGYARTKFLPDNRVLFTTDYTIDGTRIADVADGLVAVNEPGQKEPVFKRGLQTEILVNEFSKNVFRRVASARIPRIHLPECFLYATVGA